MTVCGLFVVSLTASWPANAAAADSPVMPDARRVAELAAMLPSSPTGLGHPITDRDAWQPITQANQASSVVVAAEKLVATPIPELTDDLYLDFSRTGNRSRCQRVLGLRHTRISQLTLAECLEDQGRFLKPLEDSIRAVCSEKTWVMPAHDHGLKTFRGEERNIDLAVASLSWELATADYWLGDRLSPQIRLLIRDELQRRTFDPFRQYVNTGAPRMWWATGTNNWNAVCVAGTVGAALAVVESPEERAFFVAAAEKSIQYFLSGFTSDGYCSEGTGYWNYGFGHYVLLAETLRQATDNRLDWMAVPKVESIAAYGKRIEILDGVYPAFADCSINARPDPRLMAYLSRVFRFGMTDVERHGLGLDGGLPGSLVGLGVYGFPNAAGQVPSAEPTPLAPRDYFTEAGILICRPGAGSKAQFGVALKGGHNAEHHNHNDVGSFLLAIGGGAPLLDPGAEVYTARTFSSKRYDSDVLNSFGHPVPRVAGKLQRNGRQAEAKVLRTQFTDASDTVVLDLRAAYDVKELQQLQRTFVYSREGTGSLSVTDEVQFSGPQSFGTALITFSKWRQTAPNRLVVGEGEQAVEVTIDAGGLEMKIEPAEITEDLKGGRIPTRLGLELREPAAHATIALTIRPVED
jgi:hypothetical protein